MHQGFTVWFTGMSGAGKSTISALLENRLRARYGNDMTEVYRSTVLRGRPDKGMPVWGQILDAKTIDLIYAYLKSVQSEPE